MKSSGTRQQLKSIYINKQKEQITKLCPYKCVLTYLHAGVYNSFIDNYQTSKATNMSFSGYMDDKKVYMYTWNIIQCLKK